MFIVSSSYRGCHKKGLVYFIAHICLKGTVKYYNLSFFGWDFWCLSVFERCEVSSFNFSNYTLTNSISKRNFLIFSSGKMSWKSLTSAFINSIHFLVALLIIMDSKVESGNPDAKRLYDDLLSNYNKLVRPVANISETVTVHLKLKLSQLIAVVSPTQNVR